MLYWEQTFVLTAKAFHFRRDLSNKAQIYRRGMRGIFPLLMVEKRLFGAFYFLRNKI